MRSIKLAKTAANDWHDVDSLQVAMHSLVYTFLYQCTQFAAFQFDFYNVHMGIIVTAL